MHTQTPTHEPKHTVAPLCVPSIAISRVSQDTLNLPGLPQAKRLMKTRAAPKHAQYDTSPQAVSSRPGLLVSSVQTNLGPIISLAWFCLPRLPCEFSADTLTCSIGPCSVQFFGVFANPVRWSLGNTMWRAVLGTSAPGSLRVHR